MLFTEVGFANYCNCSFVEI